MISEPRRLTGAAEPSARSLDPPPLQAQNVLQAKDDETMTKTLNVAMIGGGFMGKAHALAYAAMPMFFWPAPAIPRRKLVVDVTADLAETARQRFGFDEASTDWRAVVAREDIDVIDIVTPNDSHAEIAIAAARAGKHVICEKPLARTAGEAKPMLDAVEAAGVTHMVAFNYRRTPAIALARKYIEDGRIGKILSFRGTYLQDWSADPNGPLSWRFQKKIAGSGAVGDIGTHVIDLARYLVGEISAVNAVVKTYIAIRVRMQSGGFDQLAASDKSGKGPRGIVDVDDEMLTLVKFANGATGSIEATRNAYGRNNFITLRNPRRQRIDRVQLRAHGRTASHVRRRSGRRARVSHRLHRPRPSLWWGALADSGARHRLRRDQNHRVLRFHQRGRQGPAGFAELPRRISHLANRRRDTSLRRNSNLDERRLETELRIEAKAAFRALRRKVDGEPTLDPIREFSPPSIFGRRRRCKLRAAA